MKKIITTTLLIIAGMAARAQATSDFVKGADVGFLTEQERQRQLFYDVEGHQRDCLELLKNDYQMTAIRMRVWVNPRGGSCDKNELLAMAKRVKALDMDLMVDFHYSDWWADPAKQPIPKAWLGHSFEEMKQDLRNHTIEVLSLLKENGIEPRWVQVGNETTNGMRWSDLKRTGHGVEDEKMAVILQNVTGSDHEGYWLPNISGVARSLDYYPAGSRKAEDGIGMIAFGMGKTIVDEGSAFRFCPAKPRIPISTMNGRIASQSMFYALDRSREFDPHSDIDNLVQLDLSKAYGWPSATRGLVSVMTTYGYLSENPNDEGLKSLTFNGIIKYDMIPLAKIVDDVLKLGTRTMSEPVEIEFAVNMEHEEWIDFSILQIRPISNSDRFEDIDISEDEMESALVSCNRVMGNGRAEGIRDIICVKPEVFKRSEMVEMAVELESLNRKIEDQYVLIVAGRLGSSDNWLGIPCSWPQISKAHVIVETGLADIQAEPSEGTHFFQNVTSLGCLYMSNNPLMGDGKLDFDAIMELPKIEETKHFVHVRVDSDLNVKADGLSGKAVVCR